MKKYLLALSIFTFPASSLACPTFLPYDERKEFVVEGSLPFKTSQIILRIYSRADKLLPRPTPSELQWLSNEMASGGERATKAWKSQIGVKKRASDEIQAVLSQIGLIQIDMNNHMYWLKLSKLFMSTSHNSAMSDLITMQIIKPTSVGYYENSINYGAALSRCINHSKNALDVAIGLLNKRSLSGSTS